MLCHACGSRLTSGARFCHSCSTPINGANGPHAGGGTQPRDLSGLRPDTTDGAPPSAQSSIRPLTSKRPETNGFLVEKAGQRPAGTRLARNGVPFLVGTCFLIVALGFIFATGRGPELLSTFGTPTPSSTSSRVSDVPSEVSADSRWQEILLKVNGVWGRDWQTTISLIDAFRSSAPEHDESKQKLYDALIAYGQLLNGGGDTQKATAQWVRARDLLPGRPDATLLLASLTPLATTIPTATLVPTSTPVPNIPTAVVASPVLTNIPVTGRSGNDVVNRWSAWGTKGTAPGQFDGPRGIAVDRQGNVYVSEYGNNRIQKFSASGQLIEVIGRQGALAGQMDQPFGLFVDLRGTLFVAEWGNNRVQRFATAGQPAYVWGSASGQKSAVRGEFNFPQGIAFDAQGMMYVTDAGNHRVQVFAPSGQLQAVWGQRGDAPGQFYAPDGIAIDGAGNIYVTEYGNNRVQVLSPDGRPLFMWGSRGSGTGEFSGAAGVVIDRVGDVYVADQGNARILKFSGRGVPLGSWGSGVKSTGIGQFNTPVGLAIGPDGSLYVTDFGNNRVQRLTLP